jgi:hypothetical protein
MGCKDTCSTPCATAILAAKRQTVSHRDQMQLSLNAFKRCHTAYNHLQPPFNPSTARPTHPNSSVNVKNHVSTLRNTQIAHQAHHTNAVVSRYKARCNVNMSSSTAHVQPTPSHKNGHQHPKHEMDFTITPQRQPLQIPSHHCTVFKQPHTLCTSATLAPISISIIFPKWTNTQRKTDIQTTQQHSPAQPIANTTKSVESNSQTRNATPDSHPNSHIHPQIHTHDGCPLAHKVTIIHFHTSACLI